ncbi:MAG: DNA-directed RNA polymerase subunit B'' [archaeon]|nr:DNA-directed RNA polymerase subunit B'' [archaeon]
MEKQNTGWSLINSYFRNKNIAQMEIDSFNQFVDLKLNEIISENKTISPKIEEVKIEIDKIEILKPRIIEADGSPRTNFYPMESRLRNRTYAGPIFLSMKLLRRDVEQDQKKAYIGELPIMLKSNKCWLNGKSEEELIEMGEDPKDFGGYFIVNGSEKALMTQEVLASDRVLVSKQAQEKVIAEVISTKGAFKGRVRIARTPDGALNVTFPASPRKLKLFVLLKALGLNSDKDIMEAFPEEQEVMNDVLLNLENIEEKNQEEALDKIGKFVAPGQVIDYRLRRAKEVVDAFLLPHIGQKESDRLAKAYYLAMMATKAIELANGLREEDDKDHYRNKRLELSGKLMEHLFRYSFKYFIKDLKFQIDRTITRRRKLNISTVVRPGAVSERIRFAMSTGNWIGRATGVSKFMDRVNYISPLTDLRKVKSPLDKNRELYEARDVHGTHWGRLDAIETPDGPQCVAPETTITLNDGTITTIKEYENNWRQQKIKAIDWETKEEKEADSARYLKIQPNKKVLEIKTKQGRNITATIDHPFYSERLEKTELGNLNIGDKIAAMPGNPLQFEQPTEKQILSVEEIEKSIPIKSDKEYILNELKSKNLAPLIDNERLPIIARILGHLFGDGSLTFSEKQFKTNCTLVFSGREKDLQEIAIDLEKLGFNSSKITKWKKVSQLSNGRIISGISTRMDCYSKPLWVLFNALGAVQGDKTLQESIIPEWIKNSRKLVKKEFLSAYFGSEMTTPKIDKRNGKIFLQPAYSLNKAKNLEQNGLKFVEEIKQLLEEFGVKTKSAKIVYGIKRKSGIETSKIKAFIASDLENLMNLYGIIGFEYCTERKSLARFAFAYLNEKKIMIEKRIVMQKIVLEMHNNGKTISQISNELNEIRNHDVANWLTKNKTGKIRVSEKDFPTLSNWMRENAIAENGLVWESIESIKEIECNDVRDITTLQDYHNFFANGFLTGNCGLVKNLAILSEVTVEADEANVEETLNRFGVKLKKL